MSRVCNCGGFMRRTSPDLDRKPFVGVLTREGVIKKHLLDTSDDIYTRSSKKAIITHRTELDLSEFTDGLLELQSSDELDFGQVVKRWCKKNNVAPETMSIIDKAISEEANDVG